MLAALIAGAIAYATRPYSATVQLHAFENTFSSPAEAADFVATVTSTNTLANVVAMLSPRPAVDAFASRSKVSADPQSPFISITVIGASRDEAQAGANAMASAVMESSERWIRRRISQAESQVKAAQRQLADLRKKFAGFDQALLTTDIRGVRQALSNQADEKAQAVVSAKAELDKLEGQKAKLIAALAKENPARQNLEKELQQALTRYTDQHPKVKELQAAIAGLQKQYSASSTTNAQLIAIRKRRDAAREEFKLAQQADLSAKAALNRFATNEVEFVRLQSEFTAVTSRRDDLIKARVLISNKAVEKWRRSDHADIARVFSMPRIASSAVGSAVGALAIGLVVVAAARRKSDFIRTEAELSAAADLPVLATLPPLGAMSDGERDFWAVETFELLRRAAGVPRLGSFICGIASSLPSEGRSTLVDLLARAGLKNGNRVLVISLPAPKPASAHDQTEPGENLDLSANAFLQPQPLASNDNAALARYTLATSVDHALSHRYWERSLASWKSEENAVVLVELPPASTADSLLLSSALPNVVWISAARMAQTDRTARAVTSLRKTGCNFVGAILNMYPAYMPQRASTAMWLLAVAAFCATARAQNPPPPTITSPSNVPSTIQPAEFVPTNALSATKFRALDRWQERLTVGPGDSFEVSLYGHPETVRPTTIAPDGRISYLESKDFEATGLTIDELRVKLEGVLAQYHLSPRVIVVPTALVSKKYFVFGNVTGRGVYPLDRPITVVEAIARARGFASTGLQRSPSSAVNFSHAFLVRRDADGAYHREPVDFEGLFSRGELQHNRLLAPDDYLYFPPAGLQEIYVFGEVTLPGVVPFSADMSVIRAIASRGGYTDAAFRQKILVVRGSLQSPETIVIDSAKVLKAAASDLALQPGDIVYVSRKPWAKAEEVFQAAASDFARAAVVGWTGKNVGVIK